MVMRYLRLILILMCGAWLVNPPESESCGPWLPAAQFGYVNNPGPEFVKGALGVLSGTYYRRNLVVAYRYLSGAPLTAAEIDALTPKPPGPAVYPKQFEIVETRVTRKGSPVPIRSAVYPKGFVGVGPLPLARWLHARTAVPGAPELKNIDTERNVIANGIYSAYRNCLDDAFDAATATLAARIKNWGAGSPQTAEWLRGQDQVFANCGGDRMEWSPPPGRVVRAEFHAPAPLPPGADPLLAADRQYQTAAALFYGAKFKEAAEAFRSVARNTSSPWRGSGRYLAARALIREGTVDGEKDALAAAEKALQEILANPAEKRWQASARGLLDYVRGQLRPEDRLVELGDALAKPQPGAAFRQALTDYTTLWDRENKAPAARSELADWITTFQAGNAPHAIERWRSGGNAAWLVAALVKVNPADPAAPELAAAARQIGVASPAYATAAYHGIRLLTARNDRDEARTWTDQALAAALGVPAHNAFLAERLALASDFREFLRYAPRQPVATTGDMADEDMGSEWRKVDQGLTFDWDAAAAFNSELPLRFWIEASGAPALPRRLRGEIAQAGWVRAVLLDRPEQARELAARAAELRPELAETMRRYTAEQAPDAARFDAAFAMLRNAGLAPTVRTGFGRLTKVNQIDNFRDNWWLFQADNPRGFYWMGNVEMSNVVQAKRRDSPALEFLPDAQRAEGESESKALQTDASIAPDYLCAQTLSWASTHRDDPRVPEALHLCVRATHLGMTGPGTSAWSKRAFQLLHTRYPKSDWTEKTKYWY
jgi:hypothetical protein